ncbi:MAG: F-type H+-transporting ATPase subunit b [Pseudoalteromonas tetraodonis]|jgi:F-type H+-transporting ATPase subunit b
MDVLKDTLSQFGVTWPKFLAQVLIFLIVYLILKKYAFGPVLEILETRRTRIAEGEENLKKIKADLEAAEETKTEVISAANEQAERLITEARDSAELVGDKKRVEAQSEANTIITKARETTELERSQMLSQLKGDFGRLVIDTASKVTGKVLTDDDQKKINEETVGQMSL